MDDILGKRQGPEVVPSVIHSSCSSVRSEFIAYWNIIHLSGHLKTGLILWNSMTLTAFVFTEMANTMKYGEGVLYNLVFTEWRHCVSQNEVWGRGCYITLFSPSDVTAFHRIEKDCPSESHLRCPDVHLMLGQRPSSTWPSTKLASGQCIMLTDSESTLKQRWDSVSPLLAGISIFLS